MAAMATHLSLKGFLLQCPFVLSLLNTNLNNWISGHQPEVSKYLIALPIMNLSAFSAIYMFHLVIPKKYSLQQFDHQARSPKLGKLSQYFRFEYDLLTRDHNWYRMSQKIETVIAMLDQITFNVNKINICIE